MKDETRKKRAAEKLAALFGLEAPVEPTKDERVNAATISREAEAVLLYVEDRNKFQTKPCKVCGLMFAVNRGSIGYCSDSCRKRALAALGLDWNPLSRTPEDRWGPMTGGPEPLVVPPSVLPILPEETQPQESTLLENLDVDELLASLGE